MGKPKNQKTHEKYPKPQKTRKTKKPKKDEKLENSAVLLRIQLHANGLERVHAQDVLAVVQRRLLVVERREAHPLEVPPVALLAPHRRPHRGPLRHVDRLRHERDLVHERYGAGDVVQRAHRAHLFPRHRHVLEQLEHRVRDVLERAEEGALVAAVLAVAHVLFFIFTLFRG